jgi:DNA-binding response OmpR family regulator
MAKLEEKTILLVEDDEKIKVAYRDFLRGQGYNVISAPDGVIGLEKAKEEKPNLILLDVLMPKMDGITMFKELKKLEETKVIPVIILTNLSTESAMQDAIDVGVTDFYVKSDLTLEKLASLVREKIK